LFKIVRLIFWRRAN